MKTFRQILESAKVLKLLASKLKIEVYKDSIVQKYVERIKGGEKLTPSFINKKWLDPLGLFKIIDGNHRAAAYKQLGKKVPVVFVNRLDALTKMGKGMSVEDYYNQVRI